MNINDALLVKMIEKDMLARGVAEQNYAIVDDRIAVSPTQIVLASNQAVYACSFLTTTPNDFAIRVLSGTSAANYTPQTTKVNPDGSFESQIITPHFSTIHIQNITPNPRLEPIPFFLRYIRIVYNIPTP